MWQSEWIGLRWVERARGPDEYDCLGLYLALLSARKGLTIPDPAARRSHSTRAVLALTPHFTAADHAMEGDALLFRLRPGRMHVGYALDASDMLHIEQDGQGSVIEKYTGLRWRSRLEGIYRPNA